MILNNSGQHAGEQRLVSSECMATVGVVSNSLHINRNIGKAGISRHMGIRPTTRAIATNPCDHPAGGKAKKHRMTPWGKTFMGVRTRNPHKSSSMIHLTRHAAKALMRK
jgi:large subunit ribosomal protein L2